MITERRGDLFTTRAPSIAHGVTCQGEMRVGLARKLGIHFPQALASYEELCKTAGENPKSLLGRTQIVPVTNSKNPSTKAIVNCFTQVQQGRGYAFSYKNFDVVLANLKDLILSKALPQPEPGSGGYQHPILAMPPIGAGVSGADWNQTLAHITQHLGPLEERIEIWLG